MRKTVVFSGRVRGAATVGDVSAADVDTRRLSGEGERQDDGEVLLGDDSAVGIPTFAEVVDARSRTARGKPRWLSGRSWWACADISTHSPFDSVIPFERLQVGGCTRARCVEFPAVSYVGMVRCVGYSRRVMFFRFFLVLEDRSRPPDRPVAVALLVFRLSLPQGWWG